MPPEWEQYIVNQMLKGVPVYTTYSIYEDVLGKIPIKYFYGRFAETQVQSTIFKVLKRISDVLLIVIASPLILLIVVIVSILIKLDSDGPVFFKQERVGQGGKVFKIVKFRTMYSDAEIDGPKFSNKNDPRVTRVGRFLRKFHLDEIPQFWNVLKGDMSLIGPRPEQVEFVREFEKKIPYYNLRHLVKPGITGWAQVQYGYAASLDETVEKLEYDLFYIKNPSIWLDLAIAIKTLRILILLER
ncbi:MAG TPA: exopolysaccharide biosynthesis polyprenyl glycosylphosphotransferase [bacterium]|nr:exopolysaccharide biosynthesis polyprenyl glycosylphosphotransferase [bacterium]